MNNQLEVFNDGNISFKYPKHFERDEGSDQKVYFFKESRRRNRQLPFECISIEIDLPKDFLEAKKRHIKNPLIVTDRFVKQRIVRGGRCNLWPGSMELVIETTIFRNDVIAYNWELLFSFSGHDVLVIMDSTYDFFVKDTLWEEIIKSIKFTIIP